MVRRWGGRSKATEKQSDSHLGCASLCLCMHMCLCVELHALLNMHVDIQEERPLSPSLNLSLSHSPHLQSPITRQAHSTSTPTPPFAFLFTLIPYRPYHSSLLSSPFHSDFLSFTNAELLKNSQVVQVHYFGR